jgi:hypothetical protein
MRLAAATFLTLAVAGAARPAEKPGCRDEGGVDRCDPEQQKRVLALFGLEPIETHRDAGDQVRRVFYVDGYGEDVVAISFVRPKGGDPTLSVHFPRAEGAPPLAPLRAPVPLQVWDDVIFRSTHFDRALVGQEKRVEDDGSILLCIHGWTYTVEASDPPEREEGTATLRRKTENACDRGLVKIYAAEVDRAAVPLLAPCALLDPKHHRGRPSLLAACGLLQGDRFAAAAVMNEANALRWIEDADDARSLEGLFESDATVDWNGEPNSGVRPAKFWATKIGESERASFYFESVVGERSDRVRLTALLARWKKDASGEPTVQEVAKVEQIWARDSGDEFEIVSAKVGPFEPFPKK